MAFSIMNYSRSMNQWAEWGAVLRKPLRSRQPHWEPAVRLMEVAKPKFRSDADELRELLEESNRCLAPLNDPLTLDMGLNRWLSKHREESYSDWLAWVIEQLPTPESCIDLFDLVSPDSVSSWPTKPIIEREKSIPITANSLGRLDVVISYGDKSLIVIEVKTTDAERSDVAKQEAYLKWIKEHNRHPYKQCILLVTDGDEDEYWDFQTRTWSNLCISLRRLCMNRGNGLLLNARALILAFIGSIEQNILRWDARLVKAMCLGRTQRFDLALVNHLKTIFKKES